MIKKNILLSLGIFVFYSCKFQNTEKTKPPYVPPKEGKIGISRLSPNIIVVTGNEDATYRIKVLSPPPEARSARVRFTPHNSSDSTFIEFINENIHVPISKTPCDFSMSCEIAVQLIYDSGPSLWTIKTANPINVKTKPDAVDLAQTVYDADQAKLTLAEILKIESQKYIEIRSSGKDCCSMDKNTEGCPKEDEIDFELFNTACLIAIQSITDIAKGLDEYEKKLTIKELAKSTYGEVCHKEIGCEVGECLENKEKTFECQCPEGYTLSEEMNTCYSQKIDEEKPPSRQTARVISFGVLSFVAAGAYSISNYRQSSRSYNKDNSLQEEPKIKDSSKILKDSKTRPEEQEKDKQKIQLDNLLAKQEKTQEIEIKRAAMIASKDKLIDLEKSTSEAKTPEARKTLVELKTDIYNQQEVLNKLKTDRISALKIPGNEDALKDLVEERKRELSRSKKEIDLKKESLVEKAIPATEKVAKDVEKVNIEETVANAQETIKASKIWRWSWLSSRKKKKEPISDKKRPIDKRKKSTTPPDKRASSPLQVEVSKGIAANNRQIANQNFSDVLSLPATSRPKVEAIIFIKDDKLQVRFQPLRQLDLEIMKPRVWNMELSKKLPDFILEPQHEAALNKIKPIAKMKGKDMVELLDKEDRFKKVIVSGFHRTFQNSEALKQELQKTIDKSDVKYQIDSLCIGRACLTEQEDPSVVFEKRIKDIFSTFYNIIQNKSLARLRQWISKLNEMRDEYSRSLSTGEKL